MIDRIGRITLTNLPTPLEEAGRLAKQLGLARLLVKRDDLTSLAMGGNKARKLEYELFPCIAHGCDVVVTVGGPQSNHAVMAAAAARKLGLEVKLVLGGPDFQEFQGNLLLDVLLGAEIRYLKGRDSNKELTMEMDKWAAELQAQGRKPFTLPIGGSTGVGVLGYVRAMRELAGQFGQGPVQVVLAVGSCGTFAGAVLGAKLYMPNARVIGISISRTSAAIAMRTAELIRECSGILGLETQIPPEALESYDGYFEEYGVLTESGTEAIQMCARYAGLLVDPVYTAKAMAGLIGLARKGAIDRSIPTIFLHTGGLPIVFAFESAFRVAAVCTRI